MTSGSLEGSGRATTMKVIVAGAEVPNALLSVKVATAVPVNVAAGVNFKR